MPALPSAVEDILERAVASRGVPGASFIFTGSEGDVLEALAGTVRVGSDDPVTSSTMFRPMTMTKALASVGAMQLIERGELTPDQEVASILPEFAELQVLKALTAARRGCESSRLRDHPAPAARSGRSRFSPSTSPRSTDSAFTERCSAGALAGARP